VWKYIIIINGNDVILWLLLMTISNVCVCVNIINIINNIIVWIIIININMCNININIIINDDVCVMCNINNDNILMNE